MKVEAFNGFLEFKEETFPFSFSDNKITIHPHSIDKWNELLGEWFHHSTNKKKWLDKIIIDGITAKRKGVKFFVTDSPINFSNTTINNSRFIISKITYKLNFLS